MSFEFLEWRNVYLVSWYLDGSMDGWMDGCTTMLKEGTCGHVTFVYLLGRERVL